MSRYDLTEFEWRVIAPLLPNKPRGVLRVDDRRVLNGIFWTLRSSSFSSLFLTSKVTAKLSAVRFICIHMAIDSLRLRG